MPLNVLLHVYFLHTRVAFVEKKHTGLSKTANVFVFSGIPGVYTKASSKKVIATTIGNRK